MHYLLLVIGDSVHDQLLPFADYTKVDPYRVFVEPIEIAMAADHLGVPADDLPALAAKWPEWAEREAHIHQGRLSYWTSSNPQGKFDWYKIGGTFAGYLHLREAQTPSLLGRILRKKPVARVNSARKGDILVADVVANPPYAMLSHGTWVEQGLGEAAQTDEQWQQQFAHRFGLLPDSELVTVVDLHG